MESERRSYLGKVEASFGSGGGSGSFTNGQQETNLIVPSQPEYARYSELLRTFEAKMKTWQTNVCTPEYCRYHDADDEQSLWTYSIVYPSTPSRIKPKGMYPSEPDRLAVEVGLTKRNDLLSIFSFEVMGNWNEAFIDPYNNERLARLIVLVQQHNPSYFKGLVKDPVFYTLIIGGSYGNPAPDGIGTIDRKARALQFEVDNLNGELQLTVGEVWYGDVYVPEDAEILSVDHAKALMDYADSLIPQVNQQLPEPGAAGEK